MEKNKILIDKKEHQDLIDVYRIAEEFLELKRCSCTRMIIKHYKCPYCGKNGN